MKAVQQMIKEQASKEDQDIMEEVIRESESNSRQKLKIIKKILDSNGEKEMPAKSNNFAM